MGWLSNVAKVAGVGLAPFTGGASLALLGVDAAAHLVGAKMASTASKNAAKTQAAAGQKAIEISQAGQRDSLNAINTNYGKAASLYEPYRQVGLSALPSLANLAGSGYPEGRTAPPQGAPPSVMGMGTPQPNAPPPQGAQGFYGGQPMGPSNGSGLVTMRAPNGMTQQVPAAQVQHYTQMGAQVVS